MEETTVTADLLKLLDKKVIGQSNSTNQIIPCIQMFQAGLAPEGRPVGVFLLLGPTGTGKTKTVEALAEVLHGSHKCVLKIDCGEFQMNHEVAKLIGAPPGYLGHRETQPLLTQQKLNAVTTEKCGLSLVLFDEIEKAAPSMTRLLLGVLDKAILQLGDNSTVNFEKSMIFLTSNLGAREMLREISPEFGFQAPRQAASWATGQEELLAKLQQISLVAVRKRFSPEFINRIDSIITYQPLSDETLAAILNKAIGDLQTHVNMRLGMRSFSLVVSDDARRFLLEKGTSREYGARELNRTIHRHLTQPLAAMVASGGIPPGSCVWAARGSGERLDLKVGIAADAAPSYPIVLLVDDNRDLLQFLEKMMGEKGWLVSTVETAAEAKQVIRQGLRPDYLVLDYILPDGSGIELGAELLRQAPKSDAVIITGTIVPPEQEELCRQHKMPVLRKPFLVSEIMDLFIQKRRAARGGAA